MNKENTSIIFNIFLAISAIIFLIGTTSKYSTQAGTASIAFSLLFIGFRFFIGKEHLKIPKGFVLYLIFVATLSIHSAIAGGKTLYSLLFASAGLYWLIFYNFRKPASSFFVSFMAGLSLLMSALNLVAKSYGVISFPFSSLFLPVGVGVLHNHLGDLWAITFIAVFYKFISKRETWHFPILVVAAIFIALSYSRSSLVSLAVGVGYTLYALRGKIKTKNIYIFILSALSLLFIFFGIHKTTIFSRPYIAEGFASIWRQPLGVGVGNFISISRKSSLAHNVIMEIATGLGIFSIPFLVWIVQIFKIFTVRKTDVLYLSVFLAIFANFFFDTTYTIPTMVWIWFTSLALIS